MGVSTELSSVEEELEAPIPNEFSSSGVSGLFESASSEGSLAVSVTGVLSLEAEELSETLTLRSEHALRLRQAARAKTIKSLIFIRYPPIQQQLLDLTASPKRRHNA